MEADVRLLPPDVFEFVLTNELKRAARSQAFLTLLVLAISCPDDTRDTSCELVRDVAGLANRELRETDLLTRSREGQLSIVLLDADFEDAMHVVERVMTRFTHYRFPRPFDVTIGAACCPTHGADPESLRRAAESRRLLVRHCDARGDASNG